MDFQWPVMIAERLLLRKPPATADFDRAVIELFELKPGKFSEIKTDNVHQFKSGTDVIISEQAEEPVMQQEDIAVEDDVKRRKELSAEEMGLMRHEVAEKLL